MVSKVIREVFLDFDNFHEYNSDALNLISDAKISTTRLYHDYKEEYFKRRKGATVVMMVNYRIEIDEEDLLWLTLTAPEIILKEVSTSL